MLALALLLAAIGQDRTTGPVFDDEPVAPPARCGATSGDEIRVCGNADQTRFRLAPLVPRFEPKPIRARLALPGGGTAEVDAVQRGVGGVSVPSAMVTLKIPFGGARKKK